MQFQLLEQLYASGRISRREFLKAAAALGAVTAIPGALSRHARAAGPQRGGHFKLGIGSGHTGDSLDPSTWASIFMNALGISFGNCLTEVDGHGKLIPELAESWEGLDGAKKWVFKLREGVTFHNGKAFGPEDVIATLELHRGEDSKSNQKALLRPITELRGDGHHLHITLEQPNADFPYILSSLYLPIMPADGNGGVLLDGIGTGGYILREFEPGVRALLERNPDYWKTGRAHFDSVELLTISDVTARTTALTTGEIHAMDRCELKTVHLLERDPEINVTRVPSGSHFTMPMNVHTPPFDNPDVRTALKLVINREEMLQKILRGYGSIGNDHPIGPNLRFHAELPQRSYDPEQARALLKKAGMEGLSLDLSTAEVFAGANDAAILYKEQAAQAGIDINVVREPTDGYWSNVWMKKPWCMCYWMARSTADLMFSIGYTADADWNDTGWNNARFNELLLSARAELDEARRAEMYREMQQLVRDDGGTPVLMFNDLVEAHRNTLAYEAPIASNWTSDGARMTERWWFAA